MTADIDPGIGGMTTNCSGVFMRDIAVLPPGHKAKELADMPVDLEQLRKLAETITGEAADTLRQAASEIGLLRRHLFEAHASNADSERLDWLSEQAHEEYCDPVCRTYFVLPRIVSKKNDLSATTLREAIDLVRTPSHHEV